MRIYTHTYTHTYIDTDLLMYKNCYINLLLILTSSTVSSTLMKYVIYVLLDLSAAFDTINHKILFIKLQCLGMNHNIIILIN